jgi:hypothetical protein
VICGSSAPLFPVLVTVTISPAAASVPNLFCSATVSLPQ